MKASAQRGFSLIEVLISVFVLTVGVVGAAGMQLVALRTSQQSVFQTQALHLATEMADRMRANVGQMRLSDDANPYLQIDYESSASQQIVSGPDCYGAHAHCDAAQLALFDIAESLRRISSELPGGRIKVCRDAMPWNNGTQRFNWECTAGANAAAPLIVKIGWKEKRPDGKPLHETGADAPAIALLVAPYAR